MHTWRYASDFSEPTKCYRALLELLRKIEEGGAISLAEALNTYLTFLQSLKNGLTEEKTRKESLFILKEFVHLSEEYKKLVRGNRKKRAQRLYLNQVDLLQHAENQFDEISMHIAWLANA